MLILPYKSKQHDRALKNINSVIKTKLVQYKDTRYVNFKKKINFFFNIYKNVKLKRNIKPKRDRKSKSSNRKVCKINRKTKNRKNK